MVITVSRRRRGHSESICRSRGYSHLALLSVALLLHAVTAHAQIEIAPYVGAYRPTSILGSGAGVAVKQQRSIALGIRVTHWWPGRLGIEGTLGYAPSRLNGLCTQSPPCEPPSNPVSGIRGNETAHVITASVDGLLRVTPPRSRVGLHVGAGLGLVTHGGFAYPDWYAGPTTFVSAIVKLGASINLTRRVAVRLDAEDFVFPAHVGRCFRTGAGGGVVCDLWDAVALGPLSGLKVLPTPAVVQNDLVLSLALTVTLDRLRLGTGSGE